MAMTSAGHFADRLCEAIARKGNAVVVGLDPRLESLPEELLAACREAYGASTRAAGEVLWQFNRAIIDAVHDLVPVVKPQLAFYERYGLEGLQAYVRTVRHARAAGLLVIADAKRNDIGPTAVAYAEAFLGTTSIFEATISGDFAADALTVNAFLGRDGIQPFIDQAQQRLVGRHPGPASVRTTTLRTSRRDGGNLGGSESRQLWLCRRWRGSGGDVPRTGPPSACPDTAHHHAAARLWGPGRHRDRRRRVF